MRVAVFGAHRDRFAVGNLWLSNVNFYTVCALEDVHLDVEVKFAHALDDRFFGILVGFDAERRIFFNHLADRYGELFGIGLIAGCDSDRDNGVREDHRLERRRIVWIAERVTSLSVLHPEKRNDVARLSGIDFLARVGMHLDDTTDTLGLASECIKNAGTFGYLA